MKTQKYPRNTMKISKLFFSLSGYHCQKIYRMRILTAFSLKPKSATRYYNIANLFSTKFDNHKSCLKLTSVNIIHLRV